MFLNRRCTFKKNIGICEDMWTVDNKFSTNKKKSMRLIVIFFLGFLTLSLVVTAVFTRSDDFVGYALPGKTGAGIGGGGGGFGRGGGSLTGLSPSSGFQAPSIGSEEALNSLNRPSTNNNGQPALLSGLQGQQHQPLLNSPPSPNNLPNPKECPVVIHPSVGNTKASNLGKCSAPVSSSTTTTKVVSPPNSTPTNSKVIHTNNINNYNNNNDICAAVVNPNNPNTNVIHSDNCTTNKNAQISVNPSSSTSSTTASSSPSSLLTINNVQGSNTGSSTTTYSSNTNTNTNTIPTANAGPNQKVHPSDRVILDGSKSLNPSGDSLKYSWLQLAGGPVISLLNHDKTKTTFVAPSVPNTTILTFQLIVNNGNAYSAPSYVTITVQP